MSIIQGIRKFIAACPFMSDLTDGVHIDFTDEKAGNYGIFPSGEVTIEEYFDGGKIKQYNFSLYACNFTISDLNRLENNEFVERFTKWIEEKNDAGDFPELPDGLYPESISCTNGMLFSLNESGKTGLYQIQCHLIYERKR